MLVADKLDPDGVKILESRGIEMDAATREAIEASEKVEELEAWLVEAATAETAADLVSEE